MSPLNRLSGFWVDSTHEKQSRQYNNEMTNEATDSASHLGVGCLLSLVECDTGPLAVSTVNVTCGRHTGSSL